MGFEVIFDWHISIGTVIEVIAILCGGLFFLWGMKARVDLMADEVSSLKKEIFDGVVETLEKAQKVEASKDKPDLSILTNINGQLVWARKYTDLKKMADILMVRLNEIRKKLNQ